MARYFTQPSAVIVPEPMIWENTYISRTAMVPGVCASDFVATDTGLLNSRGERILRAPNPVGFGKDEDWN